MNKRTLYLLGLVTLLVFPIPTFLALYFIEGTEPIQVFSLERLNIFTVFSGILFGVFYGLLALGVMRFPIFKSIPTRVDRIVKEMNLNFWDSLFLSICAGVGEELLFRSGVQFYLGPLITSVIFVAIHGYLNPMNWRTSLYGLVVLPFILIISYALPFMGIWFCIGAHFAYDFILFLVMTQED